MKTTFKRYLQEAVMTRAESAEDLIASINDGKFTKDGSHLRVIGDFICKNKNLSSLVGGPSYVEGTFSCSYNPLLMSLKGAPTYADYFYCNDNKLVSLKDIHKHILEIKTVLQCIDTPIKSHVLGLLKIKNLPYVALDNKEVTEIINKYLPEGDIFACQHELIDAGYEAFAQL